MIFARAILICCLAAAMLRLAGCVDAHAQVPPVPTNTVKTVRMASTPRPVAPAITNIVLGWDSYTNARIEVSSITNLGSTNWTVITNVPLWATNVVLPVKNSSQFFRTRAVFDGVLTNY